MCLRTHVRLPHQLISTLWISFICHCLSLRLHEGLVSKYVHELDGCIRDFI